MKAALKISLILNLGLVGGLIFTMANQENKKSAAAQPVVAQIVTSAPQAAAPIIVKQTEPFRWSQLESKDYRVYVKNLRAIGCPESALRAIVTADVDVVYQNRNNELEKQLTDLANSSLSVRLAAGDTEQTVKDEMLKLPGEEQAEIDDLLGLKPAAAVAAADPDAEPDDVTPVSVPLALENDVDLTKLGLSSEQLQAIDNLRQDFVNKVGGTNQDPNDPAYLARWQQNIAAADSMFVTTMGSDVYAQYLVLQNQAANAAQGR